MRRARSWSCPGKWKTRWVKPHSRYGLIFSTCSAASVETMNRVAALSAAALARRSISRGSSTPALSSAGSASAAHSLVSSSARPRSWSKLTFISIIRSSCAGSLLASRAPFSSAGMSVSRYSSAPLPLVTMIPSPSRPANVAACGPPAAMSSGTGRDGLSKELRPLRPEVLSLEGHVVVRPKLLDELHRLAETAETFAGLRPLGHRERGLVHRLAAAHAEEHAAGGEDRDRGHRLRDDRGVVAERRCHHA